MRALLVTCLLIAACAHTPDLPFRPDPSPPAGSTVDVFTARDGTKLLTRTWKPTGEEKAVFVIMHGLEDYSAHYVPLATKLSAAGYAVYAFDLRGHAHSAGPRVSPDDWQDYVDDLDRFLTHVEQLEPGKKVFLFGHSMGGAVATLAAERHRPKVAGLVLSAPLVAVDVSPFLIPTIRIVAAVFPRTPTLKFDHHDFSSDPAEAAAMDHDEMIFQGDGPATTTAGILEGVHQIWAGVDELTMPILAMHGTADKLTAPSGSRALIARAPATDKTLRIYDKAFHVLLHEPGGVGTHVEDDILAWLDAHNGGAAVPAPAPYKGTLVGDPSGSTQALEVMVGGGHAEGETGFAGSFAYQMGRRGHPIGWHGSLTARMADRSYRAVLLQPLGASVRVGGAALAVTSGIGIVTDTHFVFSGGAYLELPLGPVHGSLSTEWSKRLFTSTGDTPFGSDLLWLSGTVRLGHDRHYWPGSFAGIGPALSVGSEWVGNQSAGLFVMLGMQMYGAD